MTVPAVIALVLIMIVVGYARRRLVAGLIPLFPQTAHTIRAGKLVGLAVMLAFAALTVRAAVVNGDPVEALFWLSGSLVVSYLLLASVTQG